MKERTRKREKTGSNPESIVEWIVKWEALRKLRIFWLPFELETIRCTPTCPSELVRYLWERVIVILAVIRYTYRLCTYTRIPDQSHFSRGGFPGGFPSRSRKMKRVSLIRDQPVLSRALHLPFGLSMLRYVNWLHWLMLSSVLRIECVRLSREFHNVSRRSRSSSIWEIV